MNDKQLRAARAEREAHIAKIALFKATMRDKAKLTVLQFMEQNPQWTPESLKEVLNYTLRKYGLHNRYIPFVPKQVDFSSGPSGEESKVETQDGPDDSGTPATTG